MNIVVENVNSFTTIDRFYSVKLLFIHVSIQLKIKKKPTTLTKLISG